MAKENWEQCFSKHSRRVTAVIKSGKETEEEERSEDGKK